MRLIIFMGLFSFFNPLIIFQQTKNNITQGIYETQLNLYIYTYEDPDNNVFKLYRFTIEEVITCFINESTDSQMVNNRYINLVLVSFSVQFDYTDADVDEITSCNDFNDKGIFHPQNHNERLFHKNMLDYDRFFVNFQKSMLDSYDDVQIFDHSQLQADHSLIMNQTFLDQTQTLNESLELDDYHILSSQSTYYEGTEKFEDTVSERALVRALFLGFRSLDFKLQQSGTQGNVYAAIHDKFGIQITNKIDLKSAITIINMYGFLMIDSPIILNFENHLETIEQFEYLIDALESSVANIIKANSLNNTNRYKYTSLKNKILIRMNFTDDNKALQVPMPGAPIINTALDDIYKEQYLREPLLQFLSGFSFLTNMTNYIYEVTQSELNIIISDDGLNPLTLSLNQHKTSSIKRSHHIQQQPPVFYQTSVNIVSGKYQQTNKGLKYIAITDDCYTITENVVLFHFTYDSYFNDMEDEIDDIVNNSVCRSMIQVHTDKYSGNFDNFQALIPLSLGVHFVTLNSSNIDKNVIDYINFFTTRKGYREINTSSLTIKKDYKLQVDEVYIPAQDEKMYMQVYYLKSDKNYRFKRRIDRTRLQIKDGRNEKNIKDESFEARDDDFLYIEVGSEYRYSVMMKDIFISGQTQIDNDEYQVAILRKVKNYFWDGAFIKLRIIDNS